MANKIIIQHDDGTEQEMKYTDYYEKGVKEGELKSILGFITEDKLVKRATELREDFITNSKKYESILDGEYEMHTGVLFNMAEEYNSDLDAFNLWKKLGGNDLDHFNKQTGKADEKYFAQQFNTLYPSDKCAIFGVDKGDNSMGDTERIEKLIASGLFKTKVQLEEFFLNLHCKYLTIVLKQHGFEGFVCIETEKGKFSIIYCERLKNIQ